jgi:hypothetical protein
MAAIQADHPQPAAIVDELPGEVRIFELLGSRKKFLNARVQSSKASSKQNLETAENQGAPVCFHWFQALMSVNWLGFTKRAETWAKAQL